jgi:general secretion pathway protein I
MKARGFSLLEVVVALAILSLSLMAIFDLNAGAVASHVYVKRLTIATLLARSKMTDLEQKLYDKGFSNDDEEDSGDFSDEGWSSFKWRAKIIAPKTEGMTPQQLIGGLFNFPMGDGKDGSDPMGGLGSLFGAGGDQTKGLGAAAAGGAGAMGGLAAMGPMAGMIQGQFTQMVDQLTKAVREVHLTVTWKEGKQTESFDLVTHVVSMGPGTDRNGGAVAGSPGGLPGQTASGPVPGVDSVTQGPCLCTTGGSGLVCPSTGNPCVAAPAGGLNPNPTAGQTRLPTLEGFRPGVGSIFNQRLKTGRGVNSE